MSQAKLYKGGAVTVDGGTIAEPIQILKSSLDVNCNIEYISESKSGVLDDENKHYLNKLTYNSFCTLERILVAQNITQTGADAITITPELINDRIKIEITGTDGSFCEVHKDDEIYIKTSLNNFQAVVTSKESNTVIYTNFISGVVLEAGFIITVPTDITIKLLHEETKDYTKRRWDRRKFYTYS